MSNKSFIDDQYRTYVAKNKLYGNSFTHSVEKFGIVSAVVRISDKAERARQLLSEKDFTEELKIVSDEKIDDTVRDLFNYVSMFHAYVHAMPVNKSMEYIADDLSRMFHILGMRYGEYKQPIINPLSPEDIELFEKIRKILIKMME